MLKKVIKKLLLVISIICVILFLVMIYFSMKDTTTINSRTVNFGLKDIGELATQAGYFTNVQVISGSRQLLGYDIPLTRNKYIYSYDGIIKAGIDFGSIEVNVDDTLHKIMVKLPEVKILSIEIDENNFEIYDERNNIFNPLPLNDMNLSLIALKKEAQENAVSKGLLKSTRSNAEILIKGFLAGSFDMQKYSVEFE